MTTNLWNYLQAYADKHRAAGNGFGFGLVDGESVARTLSARYYKDGSEILVAQGKRKCPRRLTPRECARLMGFPDTFKITMSDTQAYRLFSQAAVVPMIDVVAQCITAKLKPEVHVPDDAPTITPNAFSGTGNWTREQLKLAFHFYCQTPFGKLDSRNKKVVELAAFIGRTSGALAMKLVNFASLDPVIVASGRVGLSNASNLDREIWTEFHEDWEGLATECEHLRAYLFRQRGFEDPEQVVAEAAASDFTGETRTAVVQQRIKQQFFRRAVLSSYRGRCCITGLSETRLLVASHIVPWRADKKNRLNPSNGLCLSAIHDKAFDSGMITLSEDLRVIVSGELLSSTGEFVKHVFQPIAGRQIELPERFAPDTAFIEHHRQHIFVGR